MPASSSTPRRSRRSLKRSALTTQSLGRPRAVSGDHPGRPPLRSRTGLRFWRTGVPPSRGALGDDSGRSRPGGDLPRLRDRFYDAARLQGGPGPDGPLPTCFGISNPFFRVHEARAGAETLIGNRSLSNFSSYDYLGLNAPSRGRRGRQAGDRPLRDLGLGEPGRGGGAARSTASSNGRSRRSTTLGRLRRHGERTRDQCRRHRPAHGAEGPDRLRRTDPQQHRDSAPSFPARRGVASPTTTSTPSSGRSRPIAARRPGR